MRAGYAFIAGLGIIVSSAQAEEFIKPITMHAGSRSPAFVFLSCDDWKSKLASAPMNAMSVYNYRPDEQQPKGEYETTEHYLQRTRPHEFYANLSIEIPFSDARYDADTQQMFIDADQIGGLVFHHTQRVGNYVGSNAFGVVRRVSQTKESTLYVKLSDLAPFEPKRLLLKVSPARAQVLKESAHLRVLGEVVSAKPGPLNYFSRASIADPKDEWSESRSVDVKPICLAVQVSGQFLEWSDIH